VAEDQQQVRLVNGRHPSSEAHVQPLVGACLLERVDHQLGARSV
jgi:hypothetical protein